MTTRRRFLYVSGETGRTQPSLLAYLPLTLRHDRRSISTVGLLDTGSAVNVLSYAVGLELGLIWEDHTTPVALTGSLGRAPARGVILLAMVETFPPVELAFAWTQAPEAPLILGQVNFFMEFDVCFFRSQSVFEVSLKTL